ncbi:MAG TPA: MbnP family protein [Chitinophagaceae bacterium]|nr:MbnP family protein [Chitinophagaceae bacterium]
MKTFAAPGISAFSLLLTLAALTSCQKELSTNNPALNQVYDLNISFKPVIDGQPLLFNETYRNVFGEAYQVTAFKYYVYDIRLLNTDSNFVTQVGKDEHYLVDASATASSTISAKPIARTYNRISFRVGVDSSRNFSGAQTGALDPAKGMFWTWSSGYIMAKLEGSSPLSAQPNNRIEYHIGGFKDPDNVVKNITLDFPALQAVRFLPGSSSTINITANVNAWFSNPNEVRISANAVCMTPGELAKKIAANYAGMFAITNIQGN